MSFFNIFRTKSVLLITALTAFILLPAIHKQTTYAQIYSLGGTSTDRETEILDGVQSLGAFRKKNYSINKFIGYKTASYTSESTPILGFSVTSPQLAVFNNQLIAFIAGVGYQKILYRRMYSDWSWDKKWSRVPGRLTFSPASSVQSVTVFNDRLVAVAVGSGGKIYVTQSDKNWNWNSDWNEVPGNGRTYYAPTVTVFNNRLVVLIRGYKDDARIYITQTDKNWKWNSSWNEVPGNGRTGDAPVTTIFNDRLVVLIRGQGNDTRIYITQTDRNWKWNSRWNEVPGDGRAQYTPSLTVFNNRLVLLSRGQQDDTRIYITQTDKDWKWNSRWNEVPGDGRTAFSPAAAVFNGMLAVVIRELH